MLCGSLDRRRVWGSMDSCICMAESPHYTPIQNKTLKKKKKKQPSMPIGFQDIFALRPFAVLPSSERQVENLYMCSSTENLYPENKQTNKNKKQKISVTSALN